MPESGAPRVAVALLCGTDDDVEDLREVVRETGGDFVLEADIASCTSADVLASRPTVLLVNLPDSIEEHEPLLDELASTPGLRVVFNDASITSTLTGWDRARWRRHLRAKLLGHVDDLPPRPEDALSLRLPRDRESAPPHPVGSAAFMPTVEAELAAEMNRGLARLADSESSGPPPQHDWASELDAMGATDAPLDSPATEGVAQEAMGIGMEAERIHRASATALDLNEDERELLGNLETLDDAEPGMSPPHPAEDDARVSDDELDDSLLAATRVDDFPENDSGELLGAADADLRRYQESTSDEGVVTRLDAPEGFAEMAAEPPAATVSSPFANLSLERLEGEFDPAELGRASYAIDESARAVSDLSGAQAQAESSGDASIRTPPDVWILLGGTDSDGDMLELLGALPPDLPVSIVVLTADAQDAARPQLSLDAWRAGTALSVGQALTLDCSHGFEVGRDGRLIETSLVLAGKHIDSALSTLAEHFGARIGLMLFDGQSEDGVEGVGAVVSRGGVVWSAARPPDAARPWTEAARAAAVLTEEGNGIYLARRLAQQHA